MRATGIVRRIDDLGRVVIPKEIRRALCIREGDPLEISTDANGVYFKKYNPNRDIKNQIGAILNEYGDEIPADVKKLLEVAKSLADKANKEMKDRDTDTEKGE